MSTKTRLLEMEKLSPSLISPDEYDHLFRTFPQEAHPKKLQGHPNSAYKTFLSNNKVIKPTCNLCDRLAKQKVPQINAKNYKKRSRDLRKIKQCIYILDNTWRRRENDQIFSIYNRGDTPVYNTRTGEVTGTRSGELLKVESDHLKAAYDYKTRLRTCLSVVDELEANIQKYENKQNSKSTRKKKGKSSASTRRTHQLSKL